MDYKEFFKLIEKYDSIVIFRHTRPDLDALGSQFGLYHLLKLNYPNKEIYKVGDESRKYSFIGELDNISDDIISSSLAIILDVAVGHLVSDNRYSLAKEVIVIDHHKNDCTIENSLLLVDTTRIACAELIADIFIKEEKQFNKEAATALYGGLVTDSGRFQYNSSAEPFMIAYELVNRGADMQYIYNNIYVETLAERRMKNYFSSKFITTNNHVAYMINEQEDIDKFGVSFFDISRGMVNVMAGIDEITIWANFTYDKENNKYVGEFRARGIEIVGIAKKYGGGGHSVACGASLNSLEEVMQVIKDFEDLNKGVYNE